MGFFSPVRRAFSSATNWGADVASDSWSWVSDAIVEPAADAYEEVSEELTRAAEDISDKTVELAREAAAAIEDLAQGLIDSIEDLIVRLANALRSEFSTTLEQSLALAGKVHDAPETVASLLTGVQDLIEGRIHGPRVAEGALRIGRTAGLEALVGAPIRTLSVGFSAGGGSFGLAFDREHFGRWAKGDADPTDVDISAFIGGGVTLQQEGPIADDTFTAGIEYGFWRDRPGDLGGRFWGVELAVVYAGGGSAGFYFSPGDPLKLELPEFLGMTITPSLGLDVSVGLVRGLTFAIEITSRTGRTGRKVAPQQVTPLVSYTPHGLCAGVIGRLGANRADESWHRVTVVPSLPVGEPPIVLAETLSAYGSETDGLRVRQVTPAGFLTRFDEVVGIHDGGHAAEYVGFLALTSVDWFAERGIEARMGTIAPLRANRLAGDWHRVTFEAPYERGTQLVVIARTQTYNSNRYPGLRLRDVDHTGFSVRLDHVVASPDKLDSEDSRLDAPSPEDVGWLALPVGSSHTHPDDIHLRSGLISPLGAHRGNDRWHRVTFDTPLGGADRLVLVQTQTYVGPQNPGLRLSWFTREDFHVRFDEIVGLHDGAHANEDVGWIAMGNIRGVDRLREQFIASIEELL